MRDVGNFVRSEMLVLSDMNISGIKGKGKKGSTNCENYCFPDKNTNDV